MGAGVNRFITIEPDRCIGCGTCRSACHDGHYEAGLQSEPRLALVHVDAVTAAVACHQCEGAPCLQVCPVNAIEHHNNMIHVIEQACVGCRLCAVACPFGAIHPSGTSVAGVAGIAYDTPIHGASLSCLLTWDPGVYTCAVKCDLCSFDPEGGPHCVQACPTNALRYVCEQIDGELLDAKRDRAADESAAHAGIACGAGLEER